MPTLCRAKRGTLRVVHEGLEYVLDGSGLEIPDEVAESIRPHSNVIVGVGAPAPQPEASPPATDPAPEPTPAPEPERERKKGRG